MLLCAQMALLLLLEVLHQLHPMLLLLLRQSRLLLPPL
jgi:hypothetical protein